MANYSTLGKCLVATILSGGGIAGACLGISGSKQVNESKVVNHAPSTDNKFEVSEPKEEQNINSSSELTTKKDLDHPEEKEKLGQQTNQEERNSEVKAPESEPQTSVKADTATLSDQGTKSSKPEQTDPKPTKEAPSPKQKDVLSVQAPKLPSDEPHSTEQSPTGQEIVTESLTNRNEGSSNKNWFSINLSDIDIFDAREWPANECPKEINGDQVVFKCDWDGDSTKPIDLHLSLSSDPELKGKRWEDVEELHFTSRGDNLATLGLIFSDKRDKEIFLSLQSKES